MNPTAYERHAPADAAAEAALADSTHAVYWLTDIRRTPHPPLLGNTAADLVIVGGGYAGLWTAIRAKERDPEREVVLLEARTVGWAASGRNGGFVEASITHGETNGRTRWPKEYPLLERLGRENLDAMAETVARYDMDCEFERTGMLAVATEPHQVDWYRDEPGFLDAEQTRERINSPLFLGSLFEDGTDCALVHPAKLATELARVATELGVRIHEQTPVRKLHSHRNGQALETDTGVVVASQVALATNVFPSLLARTRPFTVPVYDYVLLTEPLTDDQLASIGWSGREGLGDSANQFHYSRLTADNRILWGGYDAIYHAGGRIRGEYEERPETYRKLAKHFLAAFPQLSGIRFSHRWAGVIDTSTRFSAFFGTAAKGQVAYAAGFTGLGVGATRFAADVMLDLLAGERTERTELEMVRKLPWPFPPEPVATIGVAMTRKALDNADHNDGHRSLFLRTLDAVGLGFDS